MEKFASVCLSNAREKIMDTSYRSGRGERSNRISKYSRVLCDAATVEWEKEEEEEDGENKRVCVTNVTCAKERGDGRRIEYKCRARSRANLFAGYGVRHCRDSTPHRLFRGMGSG